MDQKVGNAEIEDTENQRNAIPHSAGGASEVRHRPKLALVELLGEHCANHRWLHANQQRAPHKPEVEVGTARGGSKGTPK
jgi:hypothetical protein